MDKAAAEAVLDLKEPYDYASLRAQWRKLCSEYHPDISKTTGMDEETSDDVLKDINEAFSTLKPYVENGETVTPGQSYSGPKNNRDYNDSAEETLYQAALLKTIAAVSAEEYKDAANMFNVLGDYKDARAMRNKCNEIARDLEREVETQRKAEHANKKKTEQKAQQGATKQTEGWKTGTSDFDGTTSNSQKSANGAPTESSSRTSKSPKSEAAKSKKTSTGHGAKATGYKASPSREAMKYAEAVELFHNGTAQDVAIAKKIFDELGDYKSSKSYARECTERFNEIQDKIQGIGNSKTSTSKSGSGCLGWLVAFLVLALLIVGPAILYANYG